MNDSRTSKPLNQFASHILSSPHTTTCTDADTYYKIDGTWILNYGNFFETDGAGRLTNKGIKQKFYFSGTSDVQSSKVAEITYGLFINGVLTPNAETPRTFNTANSKEGLAITSVIESSPDGYVEVFVKSSVANNDVTSNTLSLALLGVGQ